jgi:hypothetical protein
MEVKHPTHGAACLPMARRPWALRCAGRAFFQLQHARARIDRLWRFAGGGGKAGTVSMRSGAAVEEVSHGNKLGHVNG